jgi:hypothetical protein
MENGRSNIGSKILTEGVSAPSEINKDFFGFPELHEVILAEVIRDFPVQTVDGIMEEELPSWLK